jgi:outer membrane protein TolC
MAEQEARNLRAELAKAKREVKALRAELALFYGEPPDPEAHY